MDNIIKPCKSVDVFFNTKYRIYRDGTYSAVYSSRPIFKSSCYERINKVYSIQKGTIHEPLIRNNFDNILKAKRNIFDIARQNDFDLFITFTLDKLLVDRYSPKDACRVLRNFLSNKVKRNNLIYLIIPEYHKDKAIHFHGFIKGKNIDLIDSGLKTENNQTIYNMSQWNYGFSTAVKMDYNRIKCSNYITKYVTKQSKKIMGKWYFAGGKGLIRKAELKFADTDFSSIDAKNYMIPFQKVQLKYEDSNKIISL